MNKKFPISKSAIPNSFTSFNALSGFGAMIASSEGKFELAVLLIVAAAIFDGLDGIMARLTNSSSKFGVELDSLVDCVSFGAAPAFLIYNADLHQYGVAGAILSGFLLIFGSFRLARFNVELVGFDKNYFSGLPIPFQAITTAAFIYAFANDGGIIQPNYSKYTVLLVIVLSLVMVSKIKYPVLPKPNLQSLKNNKLVFLYVLGSLIYILSTSLKNSFYCLLLFIVAGAVIHIARFFINYRKISLDNSKK